MKRILTLLAAAVIAALPLSASRPVEAPADAQQTQEYRLSGFSSLDVSSIYHVELTRASRFSVKVEAPDFILPYLSVRVSGSELELSMLELPRDIRRRLENGRHQIRAEVSMPELTALRMSGASKLDASGSFSTRKRLDIRLSGATTVSGLEVRAGDANIECSGAAKMSLTGSYDRMILSASGSANANLTVDAKEANLTLSGAAKVADNGTIVRLILHASGAANFKLEGALTAAELGGSGSARINTSDAVARTARVSLSGASSAIIAVREELSVELTGASSLRYRGGDRLKIVRQNVSRASSLASF